MNRFKRLRMAVAASFVLSAFVGSGQAAAAIQQFDCSDISVCGYTLTVSDFESGTVLAQESGGFTIDSKGDISLEGPAQFAGNGWNASIGGIGGNVDPSLVFGGGSANLTGSDKVFSFTFIAPMVPPLTAPIQTYSEMGITLTPPSLGFAQVYGTSTSGFIMEAQDIDVTPAGPRVRVNKGVDLFGEPAGPYTATGDGVFGTIDTELFLQSRTGMITRPGTYEFMVVNVNYGLTPGAAVGFSGKIEQMPVPEPSTYVLLAVGLVGVAFAARRRAKV